MQSKYLIIVAGPTAVGKTAVAVALAQYFGTVVLSADSRQCYKELPIGTAQPTLAEQQGIAHHFIASHSIFEEMSVAKYESYALNVLHKVFAEKNVAIVCGGTGLYIDALCYGIDSMPEVDKNIVQKIQEDYEKYGIAWLQTKCMEEDPDFWAIAEQQNPVRLIRAIAFMRTHKTSIVNFRKGVQQTLYTRINNRVDAMLEAGLIEEVANNLEHKHLKSLATVGYSEFYDIGHWPLSAPEMQYAIDKVKQHSRNYAKRQLTWLRKRDDYHWFSPNDMTGIIHFLNTMSLSKDQE
jgi:tRNA dimethylallyltransferase